MTAGPLRRLLGLARRAADPTDDAGLLARFVATGDADAFELLVWRHGGMVLGVARRVLGNEHAAEDVFQAAFLALARQAKSVRRDGCVAGWLHQVARRAAVRAKRTGEPGYPRSGSPSARRDLESQSRRANGDPLRGYPGSPDTCSVVSRRELSQLVDEEIDRLPERFRRPVVLCYLEGRSTADVAELLGCPRGTVLSRLATAREKLRVRLTRLGVTPAILPAVVLPPVIDGGLNKAAVRAATANTATAPVMELCNGVMRAMILSKLKFAAAVTMTLGLLGGGAGWMASTPGGAGLALAAGQTNRDKKPDPPVSKEQSKNEDEEKRRRIQDEITVDRLQTTLDQSQKLLDVMEQDWSRQRIEARMRLAEADEKYKRLERRAASSPIKAADESINALYGQIQDARNKFGNDHPTVAALREQIKAAEERLANTQARFDKERAELEDAVIHARREMVTAEEQLSLLDRVTALKRRQLQMRFDNAWDEVIQIQARRSGVRLDPMDHKTKDLDRKLDDILRELADLRRELKK